MTVRLYALTCGHLTIPSSFMLAGRDGTTRVPVTAYLIVHQRGNAVFDTGLHIESQDDPAAHIGDGLAALHQFDYGHGEDIAARLQAIDVDPTSVGHVINSHFHFDHCGGNALLSEARIVVQRREWETASRDGSIRRGYIPTEFDTGQPIDLLDGEHDVFGDGSVVCFPTYGHTPGHQSLRVRTETGGEHILCGDACYLRESLATMALPGVIADPDAALDALRRFRQLQRAGARIMYGHDLQFWRDIPQAPARLG
jgi:glyoxylase-like metal-dependent hydrolase (beta-lactamase superfamily II)